jgi:hypothetical protein
VRPEPWGTQPYLVEIHQDTTRIGWHPVESWDHRTVGVLFDRWTGLRILFGRTPLKFEVTIFKDPEWTEPKPVEVAP